MNYESLILLLLIGFSIGAYSQVPSVVDAANQSIWSTALTQKFLSPTRIVWKSDETGTKVVNAESILKQGIGQADLNQRKYLTMINTDDSKAGLILDFGCEIQGGIEIVTTINS